MADETISINSLTHPLYSRSLNDWRKWRLTFEGGDLFMDAYLEKFVAEDHTEFTCRKKMTYVPAFSKVGLIEIINSIYQRLSDIVRVGGSKTYQDAVDGKAGGVDMLGSSMNTFMGTEVLPEMLVMQRVGIYVDMPPKQGETLIENQNVRPYLYVYKAEDVRSWREDDACNPNHFTALLLRDRQYVYDDVFGLPYGEVERFRYYWKDPVTAEIFVQFYDNDGDKIGEAIQLDMTRIPFVMLDLGSSLLKDIANYQIALMNLASADMRYAFTANFPFYTEQFDPRAESVHLRKPSSVTDTGSVTTTVTAPAVPPYNPTPTQEVTVGAQSGRRYPIGAERPGFIHPSPEPMLASMSKQDQLKIEIRLLLNLAISNIQPKMASAQSKGMDERTLESGLSYIGLLMEDAERQVGEIWTEYERGRDVPTINYPTKYTLKTDAEVQAEVDKLKELATVAPSDLYRREMVKIIASKLLGTKVAKDTLNKIYKEIDAAPVAVIARDFIVADVEAGLCDSKTASLACGYPEGAAEKAQTERADRLKMIQEAQGINNGSGGATAGAGNLAARGTPDASPDPALQGKIEKVTPQADGTKQPQRGKGK